jgi:hypothetical protein
MGRGEGNFRAGTPAAWRGAGLLPFFAARAFRRRKETGRQARYSRLAGLVLQPLRAQRGSRSGLGLGFSNP